ncbi:MAG: AmmeMemoRadiSam system protein A [Polyangiaceae bacterium]|nr:AmmeMemoRadiSam system protein A [Polyangiaceae bacterium]
MSSRHGLPPDSGPEASPSAAEAAAFLTSGVLGPNHGRVLLQLARRSVAAAVSEGQRLRSPRRLPPELWAPRAAFVTLELGGALRGCIGHIFPQSPLALAVIENARAAALRDPRFLPVAAGELAALDFEVSVLTVPTPLGHSLPEDIPRMLTPHRDGVVLEVSGCRATFLPQVWEKLPEPVEFLEHLSRKAGARRDAWREPNATILTYQIQAFAEEGAARYH